MSERDIGAVFSAGSAQFAAWSPLLWQPLGEALVAVSRPRPGQRVLDVCCGAGASALPAAAVVGPGGQVDAVDLSAGLLELGRAAAAARGLTAVRFTQADATTWARTGYDVVQCGYGIFFLPDMDAASTRLVGLLRPGGRFAVSTWHARDGNPLADALHAAATEEGVPDSRAGSLRGISDRVNDPDKLAGWLRARGLDAVEVGVLAHWVAIDPDLAWLLVLGSGMRRVLDGLDPAAVERVRLRVQDVVRDRVGELDFTTVIGAGTRA